MSINIKTNNEAHLWAFIHFDYANIDCGQKHLLCQFFVFFGFNRQKKNGDRKSMSSLNIPQKCKSCQQCIMQPKQVFNFINLTQSTSSFSFALLPPPFTDLSFLSFPSLHSIAPSLPERVSFMDAFFIPFEWYCLLLCLMPGCKLQLFYFITSHYCRNPHTRVCLHIASSLCTTIYL